MEREISTQKSIEQVLKRPDVFVAGKYDELEFPYKSNSNQKIHYTNFSVGPKRPIEDFASYNRFLKSIHGGLSANAMGKIPTVRNNFLEFGTVRKLELLNSEKDEVSGIVKEEIQLSEISIYPNMHVAWVVGEYNKALERRLINSQWNPLEKLKHGIEIELLQSKRKLKQFAYKMYEQELFELIDSKAAALKR